jgi:hypothetical protein
MTTSLRRSTTAVATAFILAAAMAMPAPVQAAKPQPLTIPVVGNFAGGGTFSGVMTLTSFAVQNNQVVASGLLSGVLTTAAGAVGSIVTPVAIPVSVPAAAAAQTCPILHLDLGPLTLNLLGLDVNLSRIVLDLTAESGPGNLLGNLLCSVTGLLDNATGLAGVLNRILGAL